MPDASPRFLTLDQVAEELATSKNQVYALVRQGELAGVKIGGRGQWRVERNKLEEYIQRAYEETRQFIAQHPYPEPEQALDGATPELGEAAALAGMSNPHPPAASVKPGAATTTKAANSAGQSSDTQLDLDH